METLGFTSVTLPSPKSLEDAATKLDEHPMFTSITAEQASNPLQITRRYLDNNIASYLYHSNTTLDTFHTKKGIKIQNEMEGYANSFNLSYTFGYAPQSYYLNRYPITHEKSLIKLYADKVFNSVVVNREHKSASSTSDSIQEDQDQVDISRKQIKPAFLFNTGGARFDIFKGPFTRDDQFTVIPFDNGIWAIEKVLHYDLILAVVEWLNSRWGEPEFIQSILRIQTPNVGLAAGSIQGKKSLKWEERNKIILEDSFIQSRQCQKAAQEYAVYIDEIEEASTIPEDVDEIEQGTIDTKSDDLDIDQKKKKPKLTFGYVTKDKCGSYGDDIPHRSLPAYPIPEFVLSTRPSGPSGSTSSKVHLVFYVSLHTMVYWAFPFSTSLILHFRLILYLITVPFSPLPIL